MIHLLFALCVHSARKPSLFYCNIVFFAVTRFMLFCCSCGLCWWWCGVLHIQNSQPSSKAATVGRYVVCYCLFSVVRRVFTFQCRYTVIRFISSPPGGSVLCPTTRFQRGWTICSGALDENSFLFICLRIGSVLWQDRANSPRWTASKGDYATTYSVG